MGCSFRQVRKTATSMSWLTILQPVDHTICELPRPLDRVHEPTSWDR